MNACLPYGWDGMETNGRMCDVCDCMRVVYLRTPAAAIYARPITIKFKFCDFFLSVIIIVAGVVVVSLK